jgi:hypothetical protein
MVAMYANLKHLGKDCFKMCDIDKVCHNFEKWFIKDEGSIVITMFTFILHLKTLACSSKTLKDKIGGKMGSPITSDRRNNNDF